MLSRLPLASRESLRRALAAGACRVDGLPRHYGYVVPAGSFVTLDASARITEVVPETIPLTVLYEDDDLIAVDKPGGMLAHPTSHERTGTVVNALRGRGLHEAFVLHRLDRATSGVLLAAKRVTRGSPWVRMFEARQVEKRYYAVLAGETAWSNRTVSLPIGRDGARRPPWNVEPAGAAAETRLRVLARFAGATWIEAEPVTGRTNQIRIHCAAIGHPLLGDTAYGGPPAGRLFLHSRQLAFSRPDGTRVSIDAPLPPEFLPYTPPC